MKGQNFIGKVMKITAVVFEKKEGGIDVGFQKEEESIVVGVEKLGGPFIGDKGGLSISNEFLLIFIVILKQIRVSLVCHFQILDYMSFVLINVIYKSQVEC